MRLRRRHVIAAIEGTDTTVEQRRLSHGLALDFADELAADDPRFHRERFLRAAGLHD